MGVGRQGRYFTVTLRSRSSGSIWGVRSLPAELASVIVDLRRVEYEIRRREWAALSSRMTRSQEAGVEAATAFFQHPTGGPWPNEMKQEEEDGTRDDSRN